MDALSSAQGQIIAEQAVLNRSALGLKNSEPLLKAGQAETDATGKDKADIEYERSQIIEYMGDGVIVFDSSGAVTDVNPVYEKMSRLNRHDLIGKNGLDIARLVVKPADLDQVIRAFQTAVAGNPIPAISISFAFADGSELPVIFTTSFIKDRSHLHHSIITVVKDVSQIELAEQSLRESLEILAEAERLGCMGSWKWNLPTNEFTCSRGLYRIMRFPENEKLSLEKIKTVIHADDLPELERNFLELKKKGTPFTTEFRIVLPDGSIRHIRERVGSDFNTQGSPVSHHGMVQDVTERKFLESEMFKAQKLDSIGTLAVGLAHDYNNLLAAIIGNLELAMHHIPKTEKTHDLLLNALKSALCARDLTSYFTTFAQGGYPLCKIMPVRDILTESVRFALSGSNTKTKWKIAEGLPTVKIDENQIRQVIQNIVLNARESMTNGGTLYVAASKTTLGKDNTLLLPQGKYIQITFRDEGRGIPAKQIPKVFDPYFTTKNKGITKGMGLSLPISYSIIKRHQGNITMESEEGVHTTVTIYIPAAVNPAGI